MPSMTCALKRGDVDILLNDIHRRVGHELLDGGIIRQRRVGGNE